VIPAVISYVDDAVQGLRRLAGHSGRPAATRAG